MGRQIGYARVSTDDFHGKAQKAALEAVPCDVLFFGQESGADRDRPKLAKALRAGDTLIVYRLERLGRSLIHLLQIMEELEGRGSKGPGSHTWSRAPDISMTSTAR